MMPRTETFGVHLMLDGYGADPALLADRTRFLPNFCTADEADGRCAVSNGGFRLWDGCGDMRLRSVKCGKVV